MVPPDSSRACSACCHDAGLPMRIAVAMVDGAATTAPVTIGAAPAAWKPRITGVCVATESAAYSMYPFQYAVMLPALPTGRQCTSGASPSTSQISNAAVFCPSIRYALTELTSDTGNVSARPRARVRQSSKLPSTCSSRAPCTSACASLPIAIFPVGTRTAHTMPARTAYAAALALVLPVDAQMTACDPSSAALEMATVMPRSLNDPVGLAPSTLRCTSQPVCADSRGAGTSGVPPSCNVTTGVAPVTGRRSRNSSMTPRQGPRLTVLVVTLIRHRPRPA